MALIDFDKFLASFITEIKKYQLVTIYNIPVCIKKALKDQGFEYKDGEIIKTQRRVSAEVKETGYGESEDKEKPNGGIVLEDFNEGDGFYKVNLAYLSKSQVELIENLVTSWQNPTNNTVEWSEEDEDYNPYKATVESIAEMCKHYDVASHSSLRDFYDNVKVKCKEAIEYDKEYSQRQWKPSKEQMRALHDMNLTGNISYAGQGQTLIELYNDLKKL